MTNYIYSGNVDPTDHTSVIDLRGGLIRMTLGTYADLTSSEVSDLASRFVMVPGVSATPAEQHDSEIRLSDLQDVEVPSDGDTIAYNAASGRWEPYSPLVVPGIPATFFGYVANAAVDNSAALVACSLGSQPNALYPEGRWVDFPEGVAGVGPAAAIYSGARFRCLSGWAVFRKILANTDTAATGIITQRTVAGVAQPLDDLKMDGIELDGDAYDENMNAGVVFTAAVNQTGGLTSTATTVTLTTTTGLPGRGILKFDNEMIPYTLTGSALTIFRDPITGVAHVNGAPVVLMQGGVKTNAPDPFSITTGPSLLRLGSSGSGWRLINCRFMRGCTYGMGIHCEPSDPDPDQRGPWDDIFIANCEFGYNGWVGSSLGRNDGTDSKAGGSIRVISSKAFGNGDSGFNLRGIQLVYDSCEAFNNMSIGFDLEVVSDGTDNPAYYCIATCSTCTAAGNFSNYGASVAPHVANAGGRLTATISACIGGPSTAYGVHGDYRDATNQDRLRLFVLGGHHNGAGTNNIFVEKAEWVDVNAVCTNAGGSNVFLADCAGGGRIRGRITGAASKGVTGSGVTNNFAVDASVTGNIGTQIDIANLGANSVVLPFYTPASRHALGGADPLTPLAIGVRSAKLRQTPVDTLMVETSGTRDAVGAPVNGSVYLSYFYTVEGGTFSKLLIYLGSVAASALVADDVRFVYYDANQNPVTVSNNLASAIQASGVAADGELSLALGVNFVVPANSAGFLGLGQFAAGTFTPIKWRGFGGTSALVSSSFGPKRSRVATGWPGGATVPSGNASGSNIHDFALSA